MKLEVIPFNWYDYTILVMLLIGLWSGRRSGFLKKLSLTFSNVVTLGAALLFSPHLTVWLNKQFDIAEGKAILTSFLAISGVFFLIFLTIRLFFGKRKLKRTMPAFLDNIGGGVFGVLHLTLVMVWLTIALTMSRSPFIQREVAQESFFGMHLISRILFLDAGQQTEDHWLLKDIKWQGNHRLDNVPTAGTK